MITYIVHTTAGEIVGAYFGSFDAEAPLPEGCLLTTVESDGGQIDYIDPTGAPAAYTPAQRDAKMRQPFWPCVWSNASMSWDGVPDLDMMRAEKWAEIKAARSQAEAAGFAWGALVFDSDQQSQQRIQGAVQLAGASITAGLPFEIDWTLQDNTTATLSAADLVAVGNALAAHVGGVFTIARALRDAINSATTPAAVSAVAWPA